MSELTAGWTLGEWTAWFWINVAFLWLIGAATASALSERKAKPKRGGIVERPYPDDLAP